MAFTGNPTFYLSKVLGEFSSGTDVANALRDNYNLDLLNTPPPLYVIYQGSVLDTHGQPTGIDIGGLVENVREQQIRTRIIVGSQQDRDHLREANGQSKKVMRHEMINNGEKLVVWELW